MREKVPLPIQVVAPTGRSKIAESTDPYEAVFVTLVTPDHDGISDMARVFVEEFALMGWSRDRIARMFRIPRYVAAHAVYRARGPAFVEGLLDEVLGPREG